MKKVTVYLDETLWKAFRLLCMKKDTSASKSITTWIQEQIRQEAQEHAAQKGPYGPPNA